MKAVLFERNKSNFLQKQKLNLFSPMLFIFFLVLSACGGPYDPNEGKESSEPEVPPNRPPIANAGIDQSLLITKARNIMIDGSNSNDPDGDPLTYSWNVVGEDTDLRYDQVRFTIDLFSPGDFYFFLTVDDGTTKSEVDIMKITVLSPDGWVDDDYQAEDIENSQFITIQRAIEVLGSNNIIAVMPGTYEENIVLAAGIHLMGLVSETDGIPEIHASVDNIEGMRSVVTLNSRSVLESIDVVCHSSPSTDLSLSIVNINESISEAAIRNCRISRSAEYIDQYVDGISVRSNAELLVTDGTVLNSASGEGIVVWEGATLNVENSRIGNSAGSLVYSIESASINLQNSVFHNSGYDGLAIGSQQIDINHCTIAFFSQVGINVVEAQSLSLKNTLVFSDSNSSYYSGEISIQNVELSNMPNRNPNSLADPKFVDAINGNFQLQSGSPAIGNGENGKNVGALGDVLLPP
jgi:hypothetical protein